MTLTVILFMLVSFVAFSVFIKVFIAFLTPLDDGTTRYNTVDGITRDHVTESRKHSLYRIHDNRDRIDQHEYG